MILYDIHTHNKQPETNVSGYQVRSLINVSPEQYLSSREEFRECFCFSCGIHPWEARKDTKELAALSNILQEEEVVAVGEVGLDKLKGSSLTEQVGVFREQIELAVQLDKPLIIHCVKAWDELIVLFKEFKNEIPWILHGYRGGVEQTKQLARLGLKFSIGEKFKAESLPYIPLNSIFCETDESEVSIRKVYEDLSLSLGLEFEQFVEIVTGNVNKYLKK